MKNKQTLPLVRLTPFRQEIIKILTQSDDPLSIKELVQVSPLLSKVNKTTLYRNLELLINKGIVCAVMVNANATCYELASLAHHHHAVCTECHKVMDVPCPQNLQHSPQTQANGFQTSDMDIIYHGLCAKCQ